MIVASFDGKSQRFLGGRRSSDLLARAWNAAIAQALTEFATNRLPTARVHDRFDPSAFGRFGFTRRSESHRASQIKHGGTVRPFFGPRPPVDFGRVALELARAAQGKGNAVALVRALDRAFNAGRPHMRDLVSRPGSGFAVRTTGRRRLVATVRWPGARILNRRQHADAATYRSEWADLRRGGQSRAIMARAGEIYHGLLRRAAA